MAFDSFIFLKLVVMAGLTLWMSLVVLNNLIDRRFSTSVVGLAMKMDLIIQDPGLPSRLTSRKVSGEAWHRAAYSVVLLMEVAAAALLWMASYSFLQALLGTHPVVLAVSHANLALAAVAAIWFLFLIAGLWFFYGAKMGALETTHIVLLVMTVAIAMLVNSGPAVPIG